MLPIFTDEDSLTMAEALAVFGAEKQADQAVQEMAELIQVIMKIKQHNEIHNLSIEKRHKLAEEIADVYVTLEYLNGLDSSGRLQAMINEQKTFKIARLRERIEHEQQKRSQTPVGRQLQTDT